MSEVKYKISYGLSGACKGSTDELNSVGCNNQPSHLQHRTFGGVRGKSFGEGWIVKPEPMLVAWCCSCYKLEGGEDCNYELEDEEEYE